MEVAGKKADVVIANPSGIQCDGCGVINAGRTTLTTGKVEVENGQLKGYRVKGGKVTVGQKGMAVNLITPILSRIKRKSMVGFGRKKALKLPQVKTTLTVPMIRLCTWVIKTPIKPIAPQIPKMTIKAIA